jgi:H+/gluconate symporter-like permease
VASLTRRGTHHHTTAGEVLDAAGERGYDVIVIEAGEVDVLRSAMPNAPEALIATWRPGPWSRIAFGSGAGALTSTHGAVVAGDLSV